MACLCLSLSLFPSLSLVGPIEDRTATAQPFPYSFGSSCQRRLNKWRVWTSPHGDVMPNTVDHLCYLSIISNAFHYWSCSQWTGLMSSWAQSPKPCFIYALLLFWSASCCDCILNWLVCPLTQLLKPKTFIIHPNPAKHLFMLKYTRKYIGNPGEFVQFIMGHVNNF